MKNQLKNSVSLYKMDTDVKTSAIYVSTTNSKHVYKIGYVDPGSLFTNRTT